MEQTTNYKLYKPSLGDRINVEDMNENMEILDKELKDVDIAKIDKSRILTTKEEIDAVTEDGFLVDAKVIAQINSETHVNSSVYGETGIHGFRFFNRQLQVFNGSEWIDIETGGDSGVVPGDVTDLSVQSGNASVKIKFGDPADSAWVGTKVIRKTGDYPSNVNDGILILDNKVRGKYADSPFIDSDLSNGTTYYYHFFPYSKTNANNSNVTNRGSTTLQPYKIMSVQINLENNNPETCITYADDAVGMIPGSNEWDDFFGHYPVLFKSGAEVGNLNRTDFTQFEDGTAADITSGEAGDVMIAFPRRGVKITTVNNLVTVSMTDNPDSADFEYLAHSRGSMRKEKFYLGAYKSSFPPSLILSSLSRKIPAVNRTIGDFRTLIRTKGPGYENSGFYQLIFRQSMYVLKYKNLNSQVAVGMGNVEPTGVSDRMNTGGTDKKNMDFGETTGKLQMKLFGLEDFWGNVSEWIDGVVSDKNFNILTSTDNFNDTGVDYENNGRGVSTRWNGNLSKPQGTSKTGFLVKEAVGTSQYMYFCDYVSWNASCVANFGGNWKISSSPGAFDLDFSDYSSGKSDLISSRLMFL